MNHLISKILKAHELEFMCLLVIFDTLTQGRKMLAPIKSTENMALSSL